MIIFLAPKVTVFLKLILHLSVGVSLPWVPDSLGKENLFRESLDFLFRKSLVPRVGSPVTIGNFTVSLFYH